jgi:hypothetical protein
VAVPARSRLLAFRWRAPIAADTTGCAAVRDATLGARSRDPSWLRP